MANAFCSIAPQSAACSSSSKKPCYDVFINHRGKDVKLKLASCIYQMLDRMGVQVFLDQEELEVGDSFPQAIEEAMRSASIHIAIFSPSYAESPWCVEELSLMLKIKVTIIPVFYGVEAADLRYATKGMYADAFRQHQIKRRYSPEKIKEWEEALNRVSYLNGCIAAGDKCDEGKMLRKIVDTALNKMKKGPLEVATFPVGLEEAVQDFERKAGSSTRSENVHIVGIVGMGGIGKTTLAKELYNRKQSFISRSSFLFNVRDASSTNSLHKLQEKLFKDLLIQYRPFDNKEEGMVMLAKDLTSMAVLIVLDDVDHMDQMRALLPPNLGRDSFIIVTTREVDVLTSWGISSIYHMKELDPVKAKLLFSRHAFSHPYSELVFEHPSEKSHNFEDLIERFVKACNGLPLSLKVSGAMVNGESEDYWEDQLQKISKILPKDIAKSLKLSYDALDAEVQQMFLDVACFLIGERKSLVVQIWYGSRWSGELGLKTLVNRCLVGLDKEGNIEMHDHLRDLGRQIAGDVLPSRIWNEEQISIQDGRTPIRGIVAGRGLDSGTSALAMDTYYALPLEHCMENLRPLQLLAVRGNDFREEFAACSRDLVWLRLWDFNGTNLPSWLSLKSLRVLELYNAQNLEALWQDNVQPPLQLRELIIDLTKRTCFQGLPRSIGHLRHLKKIVLNGSGNGMKTLPEELCHLGSLEILQLSDFSAMSSMPDQFGGLKNLRVLIFSGVQLTALPDSFKQLRLLEFLDISNSQTFFFTSEMLDVLEFFTELQTLKISHCPQLVELPHLTTLVSLRELDVSYTGLREIPNNIGQLTKLEMLVIGSDNLTSLPGSLGDLSCLTSLAIYDCDLLKSLPERVGLLSNLQSLKIEDTPIEELGLGTGSASECNLSSLKCLSLFNTRVSTISISHYCCPSLEGLRLRCNARLTTISDLPKNVREIMVHGCEKLRNTMAVSYLRNLENFVITDCPKLELLQIPAYMFCAPRRISVTGCPKAVIRRLDDDEVMKLKTATQVTVFRDEGKVAARYKMKWNRGKQQSILTRQLGPDVEAFKHSQAFKANK